jgi:hypothetical protein
MEKFGHQDFLRRIIGFQATAAVEDAQNSVLASQDRRTPLVLLGEGDMVPVAQALHRKLLGPKSMFVLCDRRRAESPESERSPLNFPDPSNALLAARGGTLCLRAERLPDDLQYVAEVSRDPGSEVLLTVCGDARGKMSRAAPLLSLMAPIRVPPLRARQHELRAIISEYIQDAATDFSAPPNVDADDLRWVVENSSSSLHEIQKGARRMVAMRLAGSLLGAAELLGMAAVSLRRWLGRRAPPPLGSQRAERSSADGGAPGVPD